VQEIDENSFLTPPPAGDERVLLSILWPTDEQAAVASGQARTKLAGVKLAAPIAPAPVAVAPVQQGRPNEPESATGMLALAQKLHDDYVRSGQEESDRLISEAKSQGARIVREAEETSARTLGQLEQERSLLERKIDELRVFERDYRTRLKSYLENLLGDLDNRGSALPPRSGQNAQPVGEGRTL